MGSAMGTAQEGAALLPSHTWLLLCSLLRKCFSAPAPARCPVGAGTRQRERNGTYVVPTHFPSVPSAVQAHLAFPSKTAFTGPIFLPQTEDWCGWEEGKQGECCEPKEAWRPVVGNAALPFSGSLGLEAQASLPLHLL